MIFDTTRMVLVMTFTTSYRFSFKLLSSVSFITQRSCFLKNLDVTHFFVQAFFKEHPQFVKNDFYITGESYAGHYIPALASRVHRGNKNKEGTHINLKVKKKKKIYIDSFCSHFCVWLKQNLFYIYQGFAIGNGLTNPEIQYGAYADYALDMKLITQSDHDNLNRNYATCQQSIKECSNKQSLNLFFSFKNDSKKFVNFYEICLLLLCGFRRGWW